MEVANKSAGAKLISDVEIRIGLGLIVCLFLTGFFPQIQRLAACTGVLMCTQDITKASWKSGLTRVEGVIFGGVIAIIVVLIDNAVGSNALFYVLCGIGMVCDLLVCQLAHMPKVTGRVSGITFCLVAFLAQGTGRIIYAGNRLIGTIAGALVALVIAFIWDKIRKK